MWSHCPVLQSCSHRWITRPAQLSRAEAACSLQLAYPPPDPFLRAAELLKVDPSDCLVFEDAPVGLAAARAAGCGTVGVVGTHRAEELSADILVDGLYQLRSLSAPSGGFRLQPTM